ncbi:MAG: DUF512 domain-containing protein [Atopobiaceae bacterium]|jgi:putative radical SAM enzyme (TIGR03279 family)
MNADASHSAQGQAGSPETSARRADYGRSRAYTQGAWIAHVEENSPAWEAGLEVGMRIDYVGGKPLRDIIDWRWEASDFEVDIAVFDPTTQEEYSATLMREPGQDWGVEFTDVLFDGIRTCVNACKFCFMRMLPKDARSSLMLKDDDYRLSFTQGNFVTLTNMSDEDVERVITCKLEPVNVSLHAISPDVRRKLIGPRAQRGIEVLERLCAANIEVHGQIVLCLGINDGAELTATLDWVEAHSNITSLAIVPVGYTKYSKEFTHSFSEDVEASRAVVKLLKPYQERARKTLGITRFQLSDEFYIDAHLPVPPAATYDGYPQFYDGIGMLRSFLDEMDSQLDDQAIYARTKHSVETLVSAGRHVKIIVGEAAYPVVAAFAERVSATFEAEEAPVSACAIKNDYFGGDVNVTGLIVAEDLLAQLPHKMKDTLIILPESMFNFDGITLDGQPRGLVASELALRGAAMCIAETSPHELLLAIARWRGEQV